MWFKGIINKILKILKSMINNVYILKYFNFRGGEK